MSAPAAASSSASSDACDADRGHAAGLGGLDACGGVLDHHRGIPGATPSSCAAVRNISGSGFPCAKSRPETSASKKSSSVSPGAATAMRSLLLGEGVEPDLAQEQLRVLRRRRRRDSDAGVLDGDDEAQRVGIGGEVAGLDESHHHLLLALGVLREAQRHRRRGRGSTPAPRGRRSCAACPTSPPRRRWDVNASGDQVVRSRMSFHSPSISSRSDSRHAFSCGESTSTPSTSKIAPWNVGHASSRQPWVCWCSACGARPAARTCTGRRAQLADLVADPDANRPRHALPMGGQRQPARRRASRGSGSPGTASRTTAPRAARAAGARSTGHRRGSPCRRSCAARDRACRTSRPCGCPPSWCRPGCRRRRSPAATRNRSHELSASSRASTPACATKLSVEPCEVRWS